MAALMILLYAVPGGLPFSQGLVVFKTHAYTPEKDGNVNAYTFHWDNIRFTGPVIGRYESFEANDVVYLQDNGDREIGEQESNHHRSALYRPQSHSVWAGAQSDAGAGVVECKRPSRHRRQSL